MNYRELRALRVQCHRDSLIYSKVQHIFSDTERVLTFYAVGKEDTCLDVVLADLFHLSLNAQYKGIVVRGMNTGLYLVTQLAHKLYGPKGVLRYEERS